VLVDGEHDIPRGIWLHLLRGLLFPELICFTIAYGQADASCYTVYSSSMDGPSRISAEHEIM
jgi:hypothetical protein